MDEPHWSVTVTCDGADLLTIESNCVSGKADMTEADGEIIRKAVLHLLAFIGEEKREDVEF